jgi:hypothetical protein
MSCRCRKKEDAREEIKKNTTMEDEKLKDTIGTKYFQDNS